MFRLIGGLGGKLQRDGGKQIGITNRMVHRSSFRWELRGFYGKEGRLKIQRRFSDDPFLLQQRQPFPVCQEQFG